MRADLYIVSRGMAPSRTLAQKLIAAGAVTLDGRPVEKPSLDIPEGEHTLTVAETDEARYVGRGGLKLEAALDAFRIDVTGLTLVDVGASTGGFTDCLLRRGARRVYAVDAGHGQLHPTLRTDPRVVNAEGVNARNLTPAQLASFDPSARNPDGTPFDGVTDGGVMDVSFISQTLILPALRTVIRPGGRLVSLIKPQFECGPAALSKKGVVTRDRDRQAAVDRVTSSAAACGFALNGLILSPIRGGDGNVEYVACFLRTDGVPPAEERTRRSCLN